MTYVYHLEGLRQLKWVKLDWRDWLTGKRHLITHGDQSQLDEDLQDLSVDPITLIGNTERPIISTVDGRKVVSYSLATNFDWQLTVIQDYDDAYAMCSSQALCYY